MPSIYLPPWRVDITVHDGVRSPLSAAAVARTAAKALDAAGAPSPAGIAVILTDDAELTRLNEKHMGEHGPTDVLSFPMLAPSAYPPHPGQQAGTLTVMDTDFVSAPGHRQHLGDIVIYPRELAFFPDLDVEEGIRIFLTGGMSLPGEIGGRPSLPNRPDAGSVSRSE